MTDRSRRWRGLVFVLILTTGCTAPTADVTPTERTGEIEVAGDGLPVDPDVVFDRVTRLMNASPPRPDSIRSIGPAELPDSQPNESATQFDPAPAFFELMGVDTDPDTGLNTTEARALENGKTNLNLGTILLYTGANESRTVEYVLAHEFAHYVQGARDRLGQLNSHLDHTTDGQFVRSSLLEGTAVSVTNAYIESSLGGPESTQLYRDLASRLAAGSYPEYVNARYLLGVRYVADRIATLDSLDRLFANPPRTGEQLIHGLRPGTEPPRPLSVAVETGAYRRLRTDRLGEGFIRITLRNGVPTATANAGAAGWGNDTLRTYQSRDDGQPGYVWAIRFDDERNRSQFVETLQESLASRGVKSAGSWVLSDTNASIRFKTIGPETVLVLAGPDQFVDATEVSGSNETVSIALPGNCDCSVE